MNKEKIKFFFTEKQIVSINGMMELDNHQWGPAHSMVVKVAG